MPHAHYPLVYGPLKAVLYPDYVVVGPGDEERPPRKPPLGALLERRPP